MEWHIVKIPPDGKCRRGRPSMSREYEKEVENWLIEQVNNETIEFWEQIGFLTYGFIREEDAVSFKLRWG